MVVLKNILVATDFSEPSAVAMAYGRDLARSYNATLHVLHVVEDVMMRYSPEVGFAIPDLQRDLEKAAKRDLEASDHRRRSQDAEGGRGRADQLQRARWHHRVREEPTPST